MKAHAALGALLLGVLGSMLLAAGDVYALADEVLLGDLVRGSSHICVGEAYEIGTDTGHQGALVVLIRFRAAYALKGRLDSDDLLIRLAGYGADVGALPILPGQKTVVFLTRPDSVAFELYGADQGLWEPSDELLAVIRKLVAQSGDPNALSPALDVEINTDREHYQEGADVQITVTAHNLGTTEITLALEGGVQADYVIDGLYRRSADDPLPPASQTVTLPPSGTAANTFVHTAGQMRLSAGPHTITGLVAGYASRAAVQIQVGDLGRIEGTVLDDTGDPVPQAYISAYPLTFIGPYDSLYGCLEVDPAGLCLPPGGPGDPVAPGRFPYYTAVTNDQGAYAMDGVLPGLTLSLTASKYGYDPASATVESIPDTVTVDMVLTEIRTGHISGLVLDEEGHPVFEAAVSAWPWYAWAEDPGIEVLDENGNRYRAGVFEGAANGAEAGDSDGTGSSGVPSFAPEGYVLTDSDGRFLFGGLRLDTTVQLTVSKAGFQPTQQEVLMDEDTVEVTIELAAIRLGQINGLVLDQEDHPVPEATVTAWPWQGWVDPAWDAMTDGQQFGETRGPNEDSLAASEGYGTAPDYPALVPTYGPRPVSTTTDQDGRFVLTDLVQGTTVELSVFKRGYKTAQQSVAVDRDVVDVEVVLTKIPMGTIAGTVADDAGDPVPEAWVVVFPDSYYPWLVKETVYSELDDLEAILGQLTAADADLHVDAALWERYSEPEWGDYPGNLQGVRCVQTDQAGAFSVEELPLGLVYTVLALKQGYFPARDTVTLSSSPVTVALVLEAVHMMDLEGRVVDEYGQGIAQALVEGHLLEQNGAEDSAAGVPWVMPGMRYSAVADDNGDFVMEGVPAGVPLWVSAQKDGYEAARVCTETSEDMPPVQLVLVEQDEVFANLRYVLRDQVRYELATDAHRYAAGDTIRIRYRVINMGQEPVVFDFSAEPYCDLVLLSGSGSEVWRWSGEPGWVSPVADGQVLQFGEPVVLHAAMHVENLEVGPEFFELMGFLGEPYRSESSVSLKLQIRNAWQEPVVLEGTVSEDVGPLDVWIPIPGATVVAKPALVALRMDGTLDAPADVWPEFSEDKHVAVTDDGGYFAMKGLRRTGTYEVTVYARGYQSATQLVYLIQDRTRISFQLAKIESEPEYTNASYFIAHNLRFELATDRHFYGQQDPVRIRYRLTNLSDAPVNVTFSSGQTHHFVVSSEQGILWDSAEGMAFIQALTDRRLEGRASLVFDETCDLSQYAPPAGPLTVTGSLGIHRVTDAAGQDLQVTEAETRLQVGILVGERYEVVPIFTDLPASMQADEAGYKLRGRAVVDARDAVGAYIEFATLADGLQQSVALNQMTTNAFGDLPGYELVKLVDFDPDPALGAVIESAYIELDYDPALLEQLNVPASSLEAFYWDRESPEAQWKQVDAQVDSVRNLLTGDVPPLAPIGIFAKIGQNTAVEDDEPGARPERFALGQNFPNPFNPTTTIRFDLPPFDGAPAQCELAVYNLRGQKVRTLMQGALQAGPHQVLWDGRDEAGRTVSSGVYFYRLTAGGFTQARKMVLTR